MSPRDPYDRWQRAMGRGRRASAPSRFRPIGYRAGGPGDVAGGIIGAARKAGSSGTAAAIGQAVGPPAASGASAISGAAALPGDVAGAIQRAVGAFAGMGQVLLGAVLLGAGLLLLLGETSAGGALAKGAAGGVRRAARAVPGVGALA